MTLELDASQRQILVEIYKAQEQLIQYALEAKEALMALSQADAQAVQGIADRLGTIQQHVDALDAVLTGQVQPLQQQLADALTQVDHLSQQENIDQGTITALRGQLQGAADMAAQTEHDMQAALGGLQSQADATDAHVQSLMPKQP